MVKKVVVLDMQPIEPAIGGGRIRLLGLYSGFENDLDVTYVGSFDWPGPKERVLQLSKCLKEIDIPLSTKHFEENEKLNTQILGKTIIDVTFPMLSQYSPELVNKACEEAKMADIVIFSHPWLFSSVAPILDDERQLIIYDSQNCEGILRTKLLDDINGFGGIIAKNVVKMEYEICHAADLVFACSEEDRESFVKLYGVEASKIIIVPNGVFSTKITPSDSKQKEESKRKLEIDGLSAIFVGSNYQPNIEAANLIIEAAKELPHITFVIMGGVGDGIKHFNIDKLPNLRITGFVEEHEKIDYLTASDIALNPMLSGSGTNIKMFDYMAAGIPVVTTKIGARGIPDIYENYCLCEKGDFANAIAKIASDKNLRLKIGENGRKLVCEKFSWEKISSNLGHTIEKQYNKKKNEYKSRILMISTYPPEKCGIGTYAYQTVKKLEEEGNYVDVWAIKGEGKFNISLDSSRKILSLIKLKSKYDNFIIQYHESFYYDCNKGFINKVLTHIAFTILFILNREIQVVCHEISYPLDKDSTGLQRLKDTIIQFFKKLKWQSTPTVIFHTQKEKTIFSEKLNLKLKENRFKILPANFYYTKCRDITKAQARKELDIPDSEEVFLCIGFIQSHKGFDRVAEIFKNSKLSNKKKLYIVGSLRLVYDETINYLNRLKDYANNCSNVYVKDDYISDEMFDTWLIASDIVVIPYREIWTSGVLGRAKLFDKRCIVADVGGLQEQLAEGDFIFENDAQLEKVISEI